MVKRSEDKGMTEEKDAAPGSRRRAQFPFFALPKSRLLWTMVVSLILHMLVVIFLPLLLNDDPKLRKAEALRVWLTDKPAAMKPEPSQHIAKAVVELTPSPKNRPKKANYLAEFDHSTQEEKRAPTLRGGKNASSDDSQKQSKESVNREPAQEDRNNEFGRQLKKPKKVNKNDPLSLRPNFPTEGFAKSQVNTEHLPEVKEGDKTELNAWQWRHAPFFNRVKARIGQVWSPQEQIKRFDPQGSLLGQKDRVTVLQVTIDRNGYLRDLKITDQSGVSYLDDEAERTFREASPFLYPPQELFSQRDEFSFTFAFHLYIDRGFSFGFDWQND